MKKVILLVLGLIATIGIEGANAQPKAFDGEVIELDIEIFTKYVMDEMDGKNRFVGNKPVIIDFYADWCVYCRDLAPILKGVASEYAGRVSFYKVDVDNESQLAKLFNIKTLPTLFYLDMNGGKISELGFVDRKELKSNINDFFKIK